MVSYLVAAVVALWEPAASLVIFCALPVFYGVTSEGWRGLRRRTQPSVVAHAETASPEGRD